MARRKRHKVPTIKVGVNFFNQYWLEVGLAPAGNQLVIEKAFWKFLGRPKLPHISALDGSVHLTAGNGPKAHRISLARPKQAALERMATEAAAWSDTAYRQYANGMVPTTLADMKAEGWTCHVVNPKVIDRWMRIAASHGEFRVDERSIGAFIGHLVRCGFVPTMLGDRGDSNYLRLFCLRQGDGDDLEATMLVSLPDGVCVPDQVEGVVQIAPPGWYRAPFTPWGRDELEAMVPKEPLQKAVSKIEKMLRRYPRADEGTDAAEVLEGMPSFIPLAFGFFNAQLMAAAVHARLNRLAAA